MEYMINSGESRTNEEEYVHEKNMNGAAGNVHCVSLKRESLLKCIDCLSVSSYYVWLCSIQINGVLISLNNA